MASLRTGDRDAFREIYFRYRDKLWYFCVGLLKSEEQADDTVQEVFLKLWEFRNFLDPELSLSSFLYTVTRNRVLNYFRDMDTERQVKISLSRMRPADDSATDWELSMQQYKELLMEAIEQLPPKRKIIFNMSRIENRSHKEIAAIMNISVNTVQEHISESLRSIKKYFARNADWIMALVLLLFTHSN